MPPFLALRGRRALSPFRLAKLEAAFAAIRPNHAVTGIASSYCHFVELKRSLTRAESATLERLLTYGPHDETGTEDGALVVIVPRPGTVSPWSSKATDIAHNCGLEAISRIERGVVVRI